MRIITLEVCESTNASLREMLNSDVWYPGGTVLRAVKQTHGRGQRGNSWEAEPGMNLTFSMLLRPGAIPPKQQFLVSEAIAVAIARFLMAELEGVDCDVRIKWPNDILVDGKKIAGILIENSLDYNGSLIYSIAGIGININQTFFTEAAPNATSLSALTGKYYDLNPLLENVADLIELYVGRLAPMLLLNINNPLLSKELEETYHSLLWRNNGFHKWRQAGEQDVFEARIERVEPSGHLVLVTADGKSLRYLFKEVFPADGF